MATVGCPGAGKSTLARQLASILGLPLYHLDLIWHKPDRTTLTREEFDVRLGEILAEDAWIIDGNYQRTVPMRLERADTVILLDYPTEVCLGGARERVGVQRADMPWTEEELDSEFAAFIEKFATDTLPRIYEYIAAARCEKIILHSRDEADEFIKGLCGAR